MMMMVVADGGEALQGKASSSPQSSSSHSKKASPDEEDWSNIEVGEKDLAMRFPEDPSEIGYDVCVMEPAFAPAYSVGRGKIGWRGRVTDVQRATKAFGKSSRPGELLVKVFGSWFHLESSMIRPIKQITDEEDEEEDGEAMEAEEEVVEEAEAPPPAPPPPTSAKAAGKRPRGSHDDSMPAPAKAAKPLAAKKAAELPIAVAEDVTPIAIAEDVTDCLRCRGWHRPHTCGKAKAPGNLWAAMEVKAAEKQANAAIRAAEREHKDRAAAEKAAEKAAKAAEKAERAAEAKAKADAKAAAEAAKKEAKRKEEEEAAKAKEEGIAMGCKACMGWHRGHTCAAKAAKAAEDAAGVLAAMGEGKEEEEVEEVAAEEVVLVLEEPQQQDEVTVDEEGNEVVNGLTLKRSKNTSGYANVIKTPNGKYMARVVLYRDGKQNSKSLGTYGTAREAAIAYAKGEEEARRRRLSREAEEEEEGGEGKEDEEEEDDG